MAADNICIPYLSNSAKINSFDSKKTFHSNRNNSNQINSPIQQQRVNYEKRVNHTRRDSSSDTPSYIYLPTTISSFRNNMSTLVPLLSFHFIYTYILSANVWTYMMQGVFGSDGCVIPAFLLCVRLLPPDSTNRDLLPHSQPQQQQMPFYTHSYCIITQPRHII